MINVIGHDHYTIAYNEVPAVLNGGVMRIATMGTNDIHQTVTVSEKIIWFDPANNVVNFGFNMWLKPPTYTLYGVLNGNTVFEFEEQNPVFPPAAPAFWEIVVGVATVVIAAAAVYAALKTTHTKDTYEEYWENGKLKHRTIHEKTDPQQFEITVHEQVYLVNYWGIKCEYDFPEEEEVLPYNDSAVLITGYNLNSIEITSIV